MKNIVALLSVLILTTLAAAAEPIKNPVLTQNLMHPPKLFECMKELATEVNAQAFHGPFFTKGATGKADYTTAIYIIRSPGRQKYYWYLRSSGADIFRLFTYEIPNSTAIGMFGPSLARNSVITDAVNGKIMANVDLSPCAGFLGKE